MGEMRAHEFKKEFEERSGDKVSCMLMARAYGSAHALASAGLELMPGKKELWGILIFCENSLHFFVHPSENTMTLLFRTAARADPPKEQWARFPLERLCAVRVPEKKRGLLSFLTSAVTVIEVSFLPESCGGGDGQDARGKPVPLYFESITPVKGSELRVAADVLSARCVGFAADGADCSGRGESREG